MCISLCYYFIPNTERWNSYQPSVICGKQPDKRVACKLATRQFVIFISTTWSYLLTMAGDWHLYWQDMFELLTCIGQQQRNANIDKIWKYISQIQMLINLPSSACNASWRVRPNISTPFICSNSSNKQTMSKNKYISRQRLQILSAVIITQTQTTRTHITPHNTETNNATTTQTHN